MIARIPTLLLALLPVTLLSCSDAQAAERLRVSPYQLDPLTSGLVGNATCARVQCGGSTGTLRYRCVVEDAEGDVLFEQAFGFTLDNLPVDEVVTVSLDSLEHGNEEHHLMTLRGSSLRGPGSWRSSTYLDEWVPDAGGHGTEVDYRGEGAPHEPQTVFLRTYSNGMGRIRVECYVEE